MSYHLCMCLPICIFRILWSFLVYHLSNIHGFQKSFNAKVPLMDSPCHVSEHSGNVSTGTTDRFYSYFVMFSSGHVLLRLLHIGNTKPQSHSRTLLFQNQFLEFLDGYFFPTHFDTIMVKWERDAGSVSGFFISVTKMLVQLLLGTVFSDNPKLPSFLNVFLSLLVSV